MELSVIVLTGLLDFSMAIVLSTGLHKTCDAFKSIGEKYVIRNDILRTYDQMF